MADENTNVSVQNGTQEGATTQDSNNTNQQATTALNGQKGTQDKGKTQGDNNSSSLDIEKLIQSAIDRATNKLGNDNKALRKELETLRKEKMTEEELKALEIKEKEADIADREAKLQEKENRLFAIKAIKEAGLDDGSSNSLKLVDLVMTNSEEETTAKVKALNELVADLVAAKVEQTFKANGRNPDKSGSTETKASNTIVENLGKAEAERAAKSNEILNHYLGGKN